MITGVDNPDAFGSDLPKTGIGLYVVRKLSQEMGWILALNNNIGGGTSFVLELADRLPKVDKNADIARAG